jgi:DNA processing protein
MPPVDAATFDLLRLTLTPRLGPALIARLVEAFGSAESVNGASVSQLEKVRGIGSAKSAAIARGLSESSDLAKAEVDLADRLGVRIIAKHEPEYPPILAELPDSPPILYVRGVLRPGDLDRYSIAVVGSRECTTYGMEQARRFAGVLARAGLTIVSGGARGVDSAAHRGALAAQGRTIVVQGCGLAHTYPPENAQLFDEIATCPGGVGGAILSELPLTTAPTAQNFPARNRIISGLSLGVLVVEAGERSGALITARIAAEEHGREVMVIPGRIDSPSSRGSLSLLKQGGAALVTEPGDVIAILESPAHHQHRGTHHFRYQAAGAASEESTPISDGGDANDPGTGSSTLFEPTLSVPQRSILDALSEALTLDELARVTGLTPGGLRAELTVLEIQQRVRRAGSRFERCGRGLSA